VVASWLVVALSPRAPTRARIASNSFGLTKEKGVLEGVHPGEETPFRHDVASSDGAGSLEEQVFEKVGRTRGAQRLVDPADGVGDHERHRGGHRSLQDQEAHAIVQRDDPNRQIRPRGGVRGSLVLSCQRSGVEPGRQAQCQEVGERGAAHGQRWHSGQKKADRLPNTIRRTGASQVGQGSPSRP
jgi:hypothetical protein